MIMSHYGGDTGLSPCSLRASSPVGGNRERRGSVPSRGAMLAEAQGALGAFDNPEALGVAVSFLEEVTSQLFTQTGTGVSLKQVRGLDLDRKTFPAMSEDLG